MCEASEARNRAIYERFARAWAARDIAGLMDCLTRDIVYSASIGPEPGATFCGKAAVEEGIRAMLAHDDATATELEAYHGEGDMAFPQWRYTLRDGSTVRGIDAITFRGGLIARKDAYRKVRSD